MKFTSNSSDLQRTLSKMGSVVSTKSPMPVLENILFDLRSNTLTMTATDLELSIIATLDVTGSEDGTVALPAKRLLDTIKELRDTSTTFLIDTTTNKIKITTDNGEYVLTGESAKEFPQVQQIKTTEDMLLESSSLKRIIHRTVFAVSVDELRPAMMGVLLQPRGKEITAVSTDGHRLVKLGFKLAKATLMKRDVVIPAKALNLVNRSIESGDVVLGVNETHIKFVQNKLTIISRLIDEAYPNYESVIPRENDKVMTVERDAMVSSIRRVALYSSATTHQVRLTLTKGKLAVSAQDIDFGGEAKEGVPCEYTNDDIEIGFNANYVLDILSHLDSEKISLRLSSPTKAGIISPVVPNDSDDIVMLVMPVRLNS